ncbi:MAG: BlaI/MecI/CopY family transcriptional regulator [Parasporobacterium sp.]|nr:BlaI/MecI/CopY family transcriptional regulator [Parasporobacterium sp.]
MQTLTKAEEVIMNCIWKLNDNVEVVDVMKRLKEESGKEYARTTVCVFMSFLRDKGYVGFIKRGHTYIYHPLISREEYQKENVGELLSKSFDDSIPEMINVIFSVRKPSEEEKKAIREMLA